MSNPRDDWTHNDNLREVCATMIDEGSMDEAVEERAVELGYINLKTDSWNEKCDWIILYDLKIPELECVISKSLILYQLAQSGMAEDSPFYHVGHLQGLNENIFNCRLFKLGKEYDVK